MISTIYDTSKPALFEAAGCVCIYDRHILLLKRALDRSFPGLWGIPTGKVDPGETCDQAMIRELFEETGLLRSMANVRHLQNFYIRAEEFSFLYTLFATSFDSPPTVRLSPKEHVAYRWVSLDEAEELPLMPDLADCLHATKTALLPPQQLSLFNVEENLLRDSLRGDQTRLEEQAREALAAVPQPNVPPPIVLLGPPGAGKSSVANSVTMKRPDITYRAHDPMKESGTRQYQYLTRFLAGDLSLSFICQIEALAGRYWNASLTSSPDTIFDEWIFSTLAYSKAQRYRSYLQDYEFQTFYITYLAYAAWLPQPRLTIHLTAKPETLRERIQSRGRRLEQSSHELEYLTVLTRAFEEVAVEVGSRGRLVSIDSSDLSLSEVTGEVLALLDE